MRRKFISDEDETLEFQVTSMCDILTTLLLFFIATANEEVATQLADLELPDAPQAQEGDQVGTLTVNIEKLGAIKIIDQVVPVESLTAEIEKRKKAYELNPLTNPNEPFRIIIRADKDITYEKVRDVMKAAAGAGILDVIFAAAETAGEA